MFYKVARVENLGWIEPTEGVFHRRASDGAGDEVKKSYYADGARKLDVAGILAEVHEKYAISKDPSDYLFEAIRANTTAVPNENQDAFPRNELLKYNTRLALPVYLTYRTKPHHVNHKTDNPLEARGVLIDAHYADETPPLDTCPRCAATVKEAAARSKDGIFCRRCGACVKDESVEILVAVDSKKDPTLANGVRSGALRAGSMGCNCASTACNVCQHVAYSTAEFCTHIRQGNKGTYWMRDKPGADFRRVEARALEHEFKRRNYVFDSRDFVSAFAEDGFEVRKAYEDCQDVVFEEYSRVHQPADPKALQQEVLSLKASNQQTPDLEQLRHESELLLEASVNKTAQEAPATPAAPSAPPVSSADNVRMEFDVPKDYRVLIQPPTGGEMETIEPVPGSTRPAPSPSPKEDEAPKMQSPEELGIMEPGDALPPPASKQSRFEAAYGRGGFSVRVSKAGTAVVESPAGPVLLVRPKMRIASAKAAATFGREVYQSLLDNGIVGTARKYSAAFSPRFASITDAAMNDMQGVKDRARPMLTADSASDMRGAERPMPASLLADYGPDMKKVKRRELGSTLEDGVVDHELGREKDPKSLSTTEGAGSDMREKRKDVDVAKTDTTDGGDRDLKVKAAAAALEARYQKLYASKFEAEKQAFAGRFARALKVAAKRRRLNLEESPLKAAAFDVLANDRDVGTDAATGEALTYAQMDAGLAQHLIEAAWSEGLEAEIDSLVRRAGELMRASEQYLADAERDLARQAARAPTGLVTSKTQLAPVDDVESHALEIRRQAMEGNPIFAPAADAAPVEVDETGGRFSRSAIRGALSATKINSIMMDLGQPN